MDIVGRSPNTNKLGGRSVHARCLSLTFGASATLDLLGVRAHVIDNLALEVWQLEVPSFTHDVILHSTELIELESAMTRFD